MCFELLQKWEMTYSINQIQIVVNKVKTLTLALPITLLLNGKIPLPGILSVPNYAEFRFILQVKLVSLFIWSFFSICVKKKNIPERIYLKIFPHTPIHNRYSFFCPPPSAHLSRVPLSSYYVPEFLELDYQSSIELVRTLLR